MNDVRSAVGLLGRGPAGGPSLGAWCCLRDDLAAQTLADQGFDWLCIDTQHGLAGPDTLPGMVRAVAQAGIPVITRVRWNSPGDIMWALDVGSHGVLVPMVDDAQQARAAVSACRYPPAGTRSRGIIRSGFDDDRPASLNRDVLCVVMVETREAVAEVDEIAAVEGVDAVFVGPADLALAYGLETSAQGRDDADYLAATDRVVKACEQAGKVAGIYGGSPEIVRFWSDRGYRMITLHSDTGILQEGGAAAVAAARALLR